jgi:hypothetical protein
MEKKPGMGISLVIATDARSYQYAGTLYIHATRGFSKRRIENTKSSLNNGLSP